MIKEKYGCYVDVQYGGKRLPDCVIDSQKYSECTLAEEGMKKEDCKWWRKIVEVCPFCGREIEAGISYNKYGRSGVFDLPFL